MGFVVNAVKSVGGALGDIVGAASPLINFIPGVGPLGAAAIGAGGNLLGRLNDGGQQSAIQRAMAQQGGQGFTPSGVGPDFLGQVPSGPNEQDTLDQEELMRIAGLFETLSGDLGGREDELFELFRNQLSQSQDPNFGSLSADEVANFGGQVGGAVGRDLFRPGGRVEEGLNAGIGQNIQSGFGIGGGTSNALLNSFKEANSRATDAGIAASGQFAGPLASVVNANTAASAQRNSLLGQLFQSAGANRNTALENLFGATANAQELPLGRESTRLGIAGTRQGLAQQQAAFPHILDALKGPGFFDQLGGAATDAIGGKIPGLLDKGIGFIGDLLGGGSGGGGGNPISNTFGQLGGGGTFFGGNDFGGTSGSDYLGGGSGFFDSFGGSNPIFNAGTDIFRPSLGNLTKPPSGGFFR